MTDFQQHYQRFRDAGYEVAALSVEEPAQSEAFRQEHGIQFAILADTARHVVEEWGVINRFERGGVARPAVFVLDRGRRVRYSSLESTSQRVFGKDLLKTLDGGLAARLGLPRLRSRLRSLWTALRTLV